MKKNALLFVIAFSVLSPLFAQDQAQNLQKYWAYRERLRQKFIVISGNVENYGVNVPASSRDNNASTIDWGDANNGMSHYLSMLATELWLLKNNQQDYSQTLKELYYAMLAMERMDAYSEYWWRYRENIGYWIQNYWVRGYINLPADRNGMHLREDVTPGFWQLYQDHFQMDNYASVFNKNDHYMEEISQDNIFHTMEGLALISKLVGAESVAGIPVTFVNSDTPSYLATQGIMSGTDVNFSLWAQDIVKRYIHWMQQAGITYTVANSYQTTDHWIVANPVTGAKVQEGSGDDLETGIFVNSGIVAAGQAITGEDLREHEAFILNNNESLDLFKQVFIAGSVPLHITVSWPWPFSQFFDPIDIDKLIDDYHVRTLGTYGNILGDQTFDVLRVNRDAANAQDYEHLPLMYCALSDHWGDFLSPGNSIFDSEKAMIENLLNLAPVDGPSASGPHEWSSDSRLVFPENLGLHAGENVEYSGLDYMLLHNLYYIAFRHEDFGNLFFFNSPIFNSFFGQGTKWMGTLQATNTIQSGWSASYNANKSIVLKPGFRALQGSDFAARIASRPNNYQGVLYKKPNGSGGRSGSIVDIRKDPDIMAATRHTASSVDMITDVKLTSKAFGSEAELNVLTYPNPTHDKLFVEMIGKESGSASLEVMDLSGKVLLTVDTDERVQQLDFSPFSAGMYLLKVRFNDRLYVKKITLKGH